MSSISQRPSTHQNKFQVRPDDLMLQALTPGISLETASRIDGHRLVAEQIAQRLIELGRELESGRKKLSLAGWRRVVAADAALVDSFEFQREAVLSALADKEKELPVVSNNPKLENTVLISGPGPAGATTLARQVAVSLGLPLTPVRFHDFPDSECKCEVQGNVRRKDVYIIMSTSAPAADTLLALNQLAMALDKASAGSVTAVVPYFGFSRQERRDKGKREPITAKLAAEFLRATKVQKVISIDLHTPQQEAFFERFDGLYSSSVLLPIARQFIDPKRTIILAPDSGSLKRAEHYAALLEIDREPALIHKRRKGDSEIKVSRLAGSVKGLTVIIPDDIVSTGTTIAEAARIAKDKGASQVIVIGTHPVMVKNAYEKLRSAPIDRIIVSDSIPVPAIPVSDQFIVAPTAPLIADAILRDHNGESVSELLTKLYSLEVLSQPWLTYNPFVTPPDHTKSAS